jgi:hypothetical protein
MKAFLEKASAVPAGSGMFGAAMVVVLMAGVWFASSAQTDRIVNKMEEKSAIARESRDRMERKLDLVLSRIPTTQPIDGEGAKR